MHISVYMYACVYKHLLRARNEGDFESEWVRHRVRERNGESQSYGLQNLRRMA
jgi:hypothetical protein